MTGRPFAKRTVYLWKIRGLLRKLKPAWRSTSEQKLTLGCVLRTATGDKSFAGGCTRVLFFFTAFPHSDDRMLSTAKITLGRKGKADWASTVKSAPRLMERRYGVFQTQRGSVPKSFKTASAK